MTTDSTPEKWDQIVNFFQPKMPPYCPELDTMSLPQKVFLYYDGKEALYGGAAGGGKSSALLMAALQHVDTPGYSAMLFRRTFRDLNLPGALMDRFRDWIAPYPEIRWNDNDSEAIFPSGATIGFGYLNNALDYLRYKGMEVQFIGMDEVSEIRERDYRYLFSRLRKPEFGPLSKIPLRMRCASNPAPNWVRQRFIVEGKEYGRVFVPAKLTDNPGVDAKSYTEMLAELPFEERKQLLEGDWWVTTLGTMFNRNEFIIIDGTDVPIVGQSAKACRFWDLAASEKTDKNPDPDWTVGTLCLWDQGIFYVLDVRRVRKKAEDVEALIAETAEEDGVAVAICMEQEGGSSGKITSSHFSRNIIPGYSFHAIPSTKDKVARARPFASAVANGNVRVVRSSWYTSWMDELSSFPEAGDHDDQVDSVCGAFTFLTGLGGPGKRKVRILV
jgi:predicted phage terminase large subunit-like protein